MKKLILISLIAAVLALMPFASAVNIYELEEFTKEAPLQAIILSEGDILDFHLMDGTHRLRLVEISRSNTTIKLNLYPFTNLNASMAQQVPFFGLDNLVKVDLDQDDKDDVLLDILEIKDRKVTLAIASTEFAAEEQELPEITGAPETQGVVKEQKDYSKTYWAIAIAVILLAALLYAKAIKAKGKKEEHHKKAEDEE